MKYLIIKLFLAFLILNSCGENKISNCKKKNSTITNEISTENEIFTSFHYGNKCYIDSIQIAFKLDERSLDYKYDYELKNNLIDLGYISQDTSYFITQIADKKFKYDKKNRLVNTSVNILESKIDTINYISIQTIGIQNKKQILSHSYFYNTSIDLIEMKNSYLDYNAFKNKKVRFKILGNKTKKIDSIEVTANVVNQNIDDIIDYKIIVNKKEIKFKQSIKASYNGSINYNNGIKIYNVLKMNKNFLKFKLDFTELDITKLDSLKLFLNSEEIKS